MRALPIIVPNVLRSSFPVLLTPLSAHSALSSFRSLLTHHFSLIAPHSSFLSPRSLSH